MDEIAVRIFIRRRRRRLAILGNRRRLLQLRDVSDPWAVTDENFMGRYRLSKQLTRELVEELRPLLREDGTRAAIPAEIKVLCALHFCGHGSSQRSVASDVNLGLSQASVSRCIAEVTASLDSPAMLGNYIRFPTTQEDQAPIIERNYRAFQIPGVLGFVDGTHLAIKRPIEFEELYINRKGYHSMNVQLVCDGDLRILNILARFPGSTHDSYIWRGSAVRRLMEEGWRRNIRCWLLGDSGYPVEPWLHTPILNAVDGSPEARYTYLHVRARNAVERCIGVLKARFRCLLRFKTLEYSPGKACSIINACSVLHNICTESRLPEPENLDIPPADDMENDLDAVDHGQVLLQGQRRTLREEGLVVQRALIQRLQAAA